MHDSAIALQMFEGINHVCRHPISAKEFNFLMLQLEFVAHTAKVDCVN